MWWLPPPMTRVRVNRLDRVWPAAIATAAKTGFEHVWAIAVRDAKTLAVLSRWTIEAQFLGGLRFDPTGKTLVASAVPERRRLVAPRLGLDGW